MTEFEPEFIIQARLTKAPKTNRKEWMYLVKYVGYDMEYNTWEPEETFKKFKGNMIDQFWSKVDLGDHDWADLHQPKKVLEDCLPTIRLSKDKNRKTSEEPPALPPKTQRLYNESVTSLSPCSIATDSQHTSLSHAPTHEASLEPLLSFEMLTEKVRAVSRYTFNPILNNAIAFMDNMADLERFIRLSHSADPDCVDQRDNVGLTPLDVAVTQSNPTATRVLLELGVNLAPLRSRNNGDRLAPLVSLQEAIRRERRKPSMAYPSELYNDPLPVMEQVEKLVKEVIGDYPMPSCSCGSCDDGWLSAKMRAQLQATAAKISANMMLRICSFPARHRQPLTVEQVQQDPYMKFIPLESQKKAFLTFYRGYQQIVDIIHQVLAREEAFSIPTSEDIRLLIQTLPSSYYAGSSEAQFFLDKGCHVDHVLDCVIDFAEKELGEGDEAWVADMPDCSNDLNFDLVRRKLGFWGAY